MAEESYMITTHDNPFNPHVQYDEWYAFDNSLGYNTVNYLARVVRSSDEMSESDQLAAIHQGIDEILEEDPIGIYRRIRKDDVVRYVE